jgi:hypothetical protein
VLFGPKVVFRASDAVIIKEGEPWLQKLQWPNVVWPLTGPCAKRELHAPRYPFLYKLTDCSNTIQLDRFANCVINSSFLGTRTSNWQVSNARLCTLAQRESTIFTGFSRYMPVYYNWIPEKIGTWSNSCDLFSIVYCNLAKLGNLTMGFDVNWIGKSRLLGLNKP